MFIDGEKHHRVYRGEKTYLCAVGPVTAMRTLYRARQRPSGPVACAGAPGGHRRGVLDAACGAPPRDADRSSGACARPRRCAGVGQHDALEDATLDRLPKALSARWEAQRPPFEARVREAALEVPDTACTVAVSLDPVMAPMKTGGGGVSGGELRLGVVV